MQANREEIISQADNNAQKKDDKKSTINLHVVFWLLLPKIKMMILLRTNYENKSAVINEDSKSTHLKALFFNKNILSKVQASSYPMIKDS